MKAETKAENVIEGDGFVKKTVGKRRFKNAGTGHAAPRELGEGARGVGNYRHGAPTELFKPVHGHGACAKQEEALDEPWAGERKSAPHP